MPRFTSFLLILIAVLQGASVSGFMTSKPTFGVVLRPQGFPLAGMAQPETQIKTKTKVETKTRQKVEIRKKSKTDEPVHKRDEDFQDAPMYKVMLVEDDSYDTEHVVTRLCAVIEDMDEDQAANVFQQAMQEGKAMCGKYPFERAELFKEQLLRSNPMIFCDIEEENA